MEPQIESLKPEVNNASRTQRPKLLQPGEYSVPIEKLLNSPAVVNAETAFQLYVEWLAENLKHEHKEIQNPANYLLVAITLSRFPGSDPMVTLALVKEAAEIIKKAENETHQGGVEQNFLAAINGIAERLPLR